MAVFDLEELKADLENEIQPPQEESILEQLPPNIVETIEVKPFLKESLANSFFIARPDKVELEEQVLDPDAHPGLESITFDIYDEDIVPGLLANGFTQMNSVTNILRASHGLQDRWDVAKTTNEDLYKDLFQREFKFVDSDWSPSPNILVCNMKFISPIISNYLAFFSIGKSTKELKKLPNLDNFKIVSVSGKGNASSLAPLYIKKVHKEGFTVTCIPLNDEKNLVDAEFKMIKELRGMTKEKVLGYFEEIKKVEEEVYRNINPYLSNFKNGLKRLGGADLKDRAKTWGGTFGMMGTAGGASAGAMGGASIGASLGPIGAILGGIAGAAGGAFAGMAAGIGVGAAAGAIAHPIIKGVSSVLLDGRDKLLSSSTSNLLNIYDISLDAKEELKKAVK